MLARIALGLIVLTGLFGFAGSAAAQDTVSDYLNQTSLQVKATENPDQKREILGNSLSAMTKAVDMVQGAPLTSDQDELKLERIKATLQEKSDELAGLNGFDRVPDAQLNAFSSYVVQDMEQATQTVTISLLTLLLILIIVLVIA